MSLSTVFSFALIALLVGIHPVGHADSILADELRHTVYRDGRTHYVLTYKENNQWKLQVFESVDDQLEDEILLEVSNTQTAAMARHAAYLKSIGYSELDSGEADLAVGAILEEVSAIESGETLWEVGDRRWDDEADRKFAKWVSEQVNADFFQRYNISTDCADVVIGAAWIFAYMNGLPVANTLSGSGRLVGHMTMRPEWRSLPRADKWYENQQFLTALNYVMAGTYTKSLGRDSYPIAINKDSLTPGSHHLEFHDQGGHAQLVKSVKIQPRRSAAISSLNSTLPRKVRRLVVKEYIFGDQPTLGTGFQRIRRAVKEGGVWKLKASESHSTYSLEQFSDGFMNGLGLFSMAVNAHLCGNLDLNVAEWKKTLKGLEQLILQRVSVVQAGFQACQVSDCSADDELYEEHSTPGRDDTLKKLIRGIVRTVEVHGKAVTDYRKTAAKTFVFEKGRSMSVGDVVGVFLNGRYDSDPRSSIAKRWGQN